MSTPTTAAGMFRDALAELVTDLEALGLQVVTDPRNARPFCVFVELPTFDGFNFRIADATVVLRVLASPPAAQNAADYLLANHRPDHGRQPCSGGRPADSCADR
jgi:hypothetical protein